MKRKNADVKNRSKLTFLRQAAPHALAAALLASPLAPVAPALVAAPHGAAAKTNASQVRALAPAGDAAERVQTALARADAAADAIVAIPDDERTFANTVLALDDLGAQLELDTNMVQFMTYVSTDAEERAAGEAVINTINRWLIDFSQREDVYNAVRAFADTGPQLDPLQQRLLEHTLRDFRRAGMALPLAQRDALAEVRKQIAELELEFDTNIREDETRVYLTREELAGMDEEFLSTLDTVGGLYMVGLSYPEFLPIMDRCENETTRKKLWVAYKRKGGQANVRLLEQILELRAQAADILGYENPAAYEIEIRMAKMPGRVMDFYKELRPKVRVKALKDLEEFTAAKRAHTGDPDAELKPWDYSFYKERLLATEYAVDSEAVREYFPLAEAINGMIALTERIFGIAYRDVTDRAASYGTPLWHEDVQLLEVVDVRTNEVLGLFYLDLHPRPNKYSHAAQWGLAQHKVFADGSVSKPVAALVCNFTKPTADKPSLLKHDEVETFFHEFGHGLHTILSEAPYWRFAGTGVERDFVEAPSQMLENWVWEADVLRTFTKHYQTGEPLPDNLLDAMVAARHLGSGMEAERQIFYGMYDMLLHLDAEGDVDTTQLGLDLWDPDGENVELYDPVPGTHFQAGFGHLTGYQAGYYGYQWSLVYASDMYKRFEELGGPLDPAVGMRYRDAILARGGTLDGLDLVRGFLDREPQMDAYLEHLGLSAE